MPFEMIEGWGLCHDKKYLYTTDGTEYIYKIDPDTMQVISYVTVYDEDEDEYIEYLNELEIVGDYIYANVLP